MSAFKSLEWRDGVLRMLDQRLLPVQVSYIEATDCHEVVGAIKEMVVRGAPLIGATAAFGLALIPFHDQSGDLITVREQMDKCGAELRSARPTAVNLFHAIDRIMLCINKPEIENVKTLTEVVLTEANEIAAEDVRINKAIAANAQVLVPNPATIIHHCNTGSLATTDYGTALGIIRLAHEQGKQVFCLVDETRPRLQGARLTAWELKQLGIPFQVIVDGASGHYMRTFGVDLCVVGCDRVAANGDTANKIGTYNLAIVAHEHGVPFYIAAPTTTIDLTTTNGSEITIEERSADEVTRIGDFQITPAGTPAGNPAFDITPAKYISAIITERGIAYPPFAKSIPRLLG